MKNCHRATAIVTCAALAVATLALAAEGDLAADLSDQDMADRAAYYSSQRGLATKY